MKKVLLALTMVALIATSASALQALGGRWGVGVDYTPNNGVDENLQNFVAWDSTWYPPAKKTPQLEPFISYDPDMLPALQLRLALYTAQDKVALYNEQGESVPMNNSLTHIAISGLYRLWAGDVVPYVGGKIGVVNQFLATDNEWWWNEIGAMDMNTIYGKVVVGAEWKVAKAVSVFLNWDLLTASTTTWSSQDENDPRTGLYAADGKLFGDVSIGVALYLD